MALESYGYDGTVNEQAWAQMAPQLGSDQSIDAIPGGYAAAPGSGAYTINIAPGVATSHGVMVKNTSTYTATCPAISSGTRWDTVAIYRDWRPSGGGTSRIDVLPGTSAMALAPGLKRNPGTEEHQPIWLAGLDAKKSQVTLVDLRAWANPTTQVKTALAIQSPVEGQLAGIDGVPSVYRANPNRWDQVGKTVFHRAWGRDVTGIKEGPIVLASYKVPDPGFPYRLFCTGSAMLQLPDKQYVWAEIVAGNDIVTRTYVVPDATPSTYQQAILLPGFNDTNLTGEVTVGIRVSSVTTPVGYWSAGSTGTQLNIMVVPA